MSERVTEHIAQLDAMKKYPSELFYRGDLGLLKRPMVSIVGTRRPMNYTREYTYRIANALAKRGVCVVSGAAMGVDGIAHEGAGAENTIAVVANGLDIRYPAVHRSLLTSIEEKGLVLSQFNDGFRNTGWSFVVRNELVVALGEMLIVTQADLDSGSMRSVAYAQKMGKQIFVLPHRLGESEGTNALLKEGKAEAITDVEAFAARFGTSVEQELEKDDFFYFCQTMPTLDQTVERFGERVYEAELEGIIAVENGRIRLR